MRKIFFVIAHRRPLPVGTGVVITPRCRPWAGGGQLHVALLKRMGFEVEERSDRQPTAALGLFFAISCKACGLACVLPAQLRIYGPGGASDWYGRPGKLVG